MSETSIAIITARGGSKRIPGKNIREFCGKPMIAYSIEAALASGVFDEVMVSTDSGQIAEVAKQYGAKVPFLRSEETSGDFATTADVLLEVLREYQKRGRAFDVMACIYPTAPFVTARKLQEAYRKLIAQNALMVMPVVAFSYPPQRGYVMRGDLLEVKWKENFNKRSQDLETIYHDAGQYYIYRVEGYLRQNGVITENVVPIIADELEVQDIDNESDWKLAELKYQMLP